MPNEFIARNGIISRGNLVVSGSVISTSPASFSGSLSLTGSLNIINGGLAVYSSDGSKFGTVTTDNSFTYLNTNGGIGTHIRMSNGNNTTQFLQDCNFLNGASVLGSPWYGYVLSLAKGSYPTSDYLRWEVGKINSSGSFGIGTLTPSASLHISGAAATPLFRVSNPASVDFTIQSDSTLTDYTGLYWGTDYKFLSKQSATLFVNINNNLSFANGLAAKTTMNSNGQLGIGVTSAGSISATAHVKGSGTTSSTTALLVQNANASSSLQVRDDGSTLFNGSNGSTGTYVDTNGTLTVYRSIFGATYGLRVWNGAGWFGHNAIEALSYQYPIYGAQGANGSESASPLGSGAAVHGKGGVGVYGRGVTPSGDVGSIGVMATTLYVSSDGDTANYNRSASAHIIGLTTITGSTSFYSTQNNAFVAIVSGSRSSNDIAFNFQKIGETAGSRHTMIVQGTGGNDNNLYFGVNQVGSTPGATFAVKGNGSVNINMPSPTGNYAGLAVGGWISSYPSLLVRGYGTTSSTTALLVQNSNASASLEVKDDGTTAVLSSNERPFTVSHTNGSSALGIVVGNGSALSAGFAALRLNDTTNVFTFGGSRTITALPLTVGGPTDTFYIRGGGGGSDVAAPSVALTDNTYNSGGYTVTSGTQTTVQIGGIGSPSNSTWKPASGNATYNLLAVAPNMSGSGTYSGIIRGIYYAPTVDSTTYGAHRAIETTAGDVVFNGGRVTISGSAGSGSALYAYKSGSTVLDIQGSQGQLFSVIDALSGSLMSVNDVSGLPILEVFSDDRVVMGTYGAPALVISGSNTVSSGSLRGRVVTVPTASGTASMDCSQSNFFSLTLSGSSTLFLSASNIQPGQTVNLRVIQPATSGSLTYGSQFKFAGGIPYSASASGSAVDLISFISYDTAVLYGSAIKNLS